MRPYDYSRMPVPNPRHKDWTMIGLLAFSTTLSILALVQLYQIFHAAMAVIGKLNF